LTPFVPAQLQVPSLDIDATIEQVAIRDGQMGEPADPWHVGWYPAVAQPGEATNVVLAGHRDWWNIGPTVFAKLDQLQRGDAIYLLDRHGAGFVYRVTKSRVVPADTNAQEIIGDTGVEAVTLVTCTGSFNGREYESRRVVVAERV
jgi:sortase A